MFSNDTTLHQKTSYTDVKSYLLQYSPNYELNSQYKVQNDNCKKNEKTYSVIYEQNHK